MRALVGVLLVMSCGQAWAAAPRISLELVTRPNVPLTAQQQWYKTLSNLGLSGVRIRAGNSGEQPSVSSDGSPSAPVFKVIGVVGADNALYLPGAKFASSDVQRLKKWLDELGDQGTEAVIEPRGSFGLSEKQLHATMADLRRPLTMKTRGKPARDVLQQIAKTLEQPVENADVVARALGSQSVSDELEGVSAGTALAALLRPAGLAMKPARASGGKLVYEIEKAQGGRESWPIGWKPKTKPNKILPELFEFLNVEISEIPLREAISAIQGRLKIPFLFDYNAMAARGIDLATIQAEVPSKRMTYSQVIHKLANEAKLKYELRVDEADRPFVWFTSIKSID